MADLGASALDIQHRIDREVELVMSAVELVASGGAPSTMVVGLQLTEPVVRIARPMAAARGVVIEPLWGPDEADRDVRVRLETPS